MIRLDGLPPETQREFLANSKRSEWEPFFRLLKEDLGAAQIMCYRARMERQ